MTIELTTEEPQRNRVNKWTLYWVHETDLDANYKATPTTLATAGYVPASQLLAVEAELWRVKVDARELAQWLLTSKWYLPATILNTARRAQVAPPSPPVAPGPAQENSPGMGGGELPAPVPVNGDVPPVVENTGGLRAEPAQEAGGVEQRHRDEAKRIYHDLRGVPDSVSNATEIHDRETIARALAERDDLLGPNGIESMRKTIAIVAADRDAERTQKEALLGLLKEYEADLRERGLNAYADHLYRRFSEPAEAAPVALALEPMRLVDHALAAEPAPVAKAEAPSGPAGWVPKSYQCWCPAGPSRRSAAEHERLCPMRSPHHPIWTATIEPAPKPPATTGGEDLLHQAIDERDPGEKVSLVIRYLMEQRRKP